MEEVHSAQQVARSPATVAPSSSTSRPFLPSHCSNRRPVRPAETGPRVAGGQPGQDTPGRTLRHVLCVLLFASKVVGAIKSLWSLTLFSPPHTYTYTHTLLRPLSFFSPSNLSPLRCSSPHRRSFSLPRLLSINYLLLLLLLLLLPVFTSISSYQACNIVSLVLGTAQRNLFLALFRFLPPKPSRPSHVAYNQ